MGVLPPQKKEQADYSFSVQVFRVVRDRNSLARESTKDHEIKNSRDLLHLGRLQRSALKTSSSVFASRMLFGPVLKSWQTDTNSAAYIHSTVSRAHACAAGESGVAPKTRRWVDHTITDVPGNPLDFILTGGQGI